MAMKTDYFKTCCTIMKAFGGAASQPELLDLVVESAIDTMDGKAACLFLSDYKHDTFVPKAQKGLSDSYLHANPVKASGIVEILEKNGHLAFRDATKDPRLENHMLKKREGIASILTVPVVVMNRTIGVLSLYTATQRDFSTEEIEFLKALADQGGIVIEKNRLLNRMQKYAMLFLDLASNINSTLDIREILNNLTVNMCQTLGMKGAAIRLFDSDSDALKLVASHGLSAEFLDKGQHAITATALRALKGETIVINDTTTDTRVHFKEAMETEGILSTIVTPIQAKEGIIGTLRLYSSDLRDYPEDFIVMVKALAHQGGLAIQNASMYLQLKDAKESLEKDIWSHRSWF
jgi:GAF domain-containing protein